MEKVIITIKHDIPVQRLTDLICVALEGGSNYWYRIEKREMLELPYWEALKVCGRILISNHYVQNEDKKRSEWLDLYGMEQGLKTMQEKYPRHFNDFIEHNDDAVTGDVFLQCCLFGEVLYG